MRKDALSEKWGINNQDSTEGKPEAANQNTDVPKSEFFGIDLNGAFIPSIQFRQRGGGMLFLPYASQPVISFDPDKGITLETLQKTVTIKGRGLVILAEWLGTQRVTWVAESVTGTDEGNDDVFVEEITVTDAG